MQRLICSLVTLASLSIPSSALAQYWQQNQFGGDAVIYDGRVLTNNLPPNTDTCGWVRSQGLSCQYERWDDRTRTHFVRSINNSRNRYPHYQRDPVPILNRRSNCLLFCFN